MLCAVACLRLPAFGDGGGEGDFGDGERAFGVGVVAEGFARGEWRDG
jgi:hypothetical protein